LPGNGKQKPYVDSNGNGIPNELEDMKILIDVYIGNTKPQKAKKSIVKSKNDLFYYDNSLIETHVLHGVNEIALNAEVSDISNIESILAVIYLPLDNNNKHSDWTEDDLILIELNNEMDNRNSYKGLLKNIQNKGQYYINIYAIDNERVYTLIKKMNIYQKGISVPDEYEKSDITIITKVLDNVQQRNFHTEGDEDWSMIYGIEDVNYTITFDNVLQDCDAVIEIYNNTGKTCIKSLKYSAISEAKTLSWLCDKSDIYYIKVFNFNPNIFGNDTSYELSCVNSSNADLYEYDDLLENARNIDINKFDCQHHNFHDKGDCDWVKFYGIEGKHYTIQVSNQEAKSNIQLELWASNDTNIDIKHPSEIIKEKSIFFYCEKKGIYFVKTKNKDINIFGKNTGYDLKVFIPEGGNFTSMITGLITDACSGIPIVNACANVNFKNSFISNTKGAYVLRHDETGIHTVYAEATGYNNFSENVFFEPISNFLEPFDIKMYPVVSIKDAVVALQILAGISPVDCYDINKITLDYVINMLSDISSFLSKEDN